MSQPQKISFAEIAQYFSHMDSKYNYFHGKIFSFIVPEPAKFIQFITSLEVRRESLPNKHPAQIMVGDFSKLIEVQSIFVPVVGAEAKLEVHCIISKCQLPDGQYFSIVSPAEKKNSSTAYELAFETISFLRSFIALHFGKLPFYSWIADFDFDMNGKVHLPGETFRMPLYADFLKIIDAELARDILDRLELQLPEFRNRIQRASNFFNYAMNQKDEMFRFSAYWISLEILAGGIDDAIKAELANAYGLKKHLVGEHLLFDEISNTRHDLLHQGLFTTMQSYQERLVQLYFWDIVIHKIGLPAHRLARTLIESGLIEQERKKHG